MKFLSYPDTVLTASDLETSVLGPTLEMPVPRVEGCGFGSRIVQQTLLQAAVGQKSIRAVTDTARGTYSGDCTPAQLHTVPPYDLETVVT